MFTMTEAQRDEQFWRKVKRSSRCWEWMGPRTQLGYGLSRIDGKCVTAARRAWHLVNGPIADGLQVCHHCDNPPCVRPDHLFLGTAKDNMADRLRKGRRSVPQRMSAPKRRQIGVFGETHGRSKLSAIDVQEIRRWYATGQPSMSQLARIYEVNISSICRIIRGRLWGHLAA